MFALGTFDELLELNVEEFHSELAKEKVVPEGVVIEPVVPSFFSNGKRVIIKKKSKAFTENKSKHNKKPPKKLSQQAEQYFSSVVEYINANRLSNVVSKIGLSDKKDFGKIIGLLIQDALKDFDSDNPELEKLVEKQELKRVKKMLNGLAAATIKENWSSVFNN